MKKKILYLLQITCIAFGTCHAQLPFSTADFVDINNIKARIMVHGDIFWDPMAGVVSCEFPKGSGKHINFASALWMSGFDASNQLHVAVQTYRQNGNDYWPGPIATGDSISYVVSHNWAKIWKVNRADIDSFLALGTHTTSNTPSMILTWSGNGNLNATGNGGVSLSITESMAPFVDLNGNGI